MELEHIKKIKFSSKKNLINNICNVYVDIKKQEKFFELNKFKTNNELLEIKKMNNMKDISFFEIALNHLNKWDKKIITKEFIEKKKENWFLDYWSRSSFYKKYHDAVDNFIYILYS